MSSQKFKIAQLRAQSQLVMVEALALFIFALFVNIFLPQILFQYVYANQDLLAEPALLTYIPTVSFAVSTLYFVFAAVGNFFRRRQIAKLTQEMNSSYANDGCCGGNCNCCTDQPDDETLAEMEKVVDEILSSNQKTKRSSKRSK